MPRDCVDCQKWELLLAKTADLGEQRAIAHVATELVVHRVLDHGATGAAATLIHTPDGGLAAVCWRCVSLRTLHVSGDADRRAVVRALADHHGGECAARPVLQETTP